jgi:hypothetical protein
MQPIAGRVVITMCGGLPCFSYPINDFSRNREFSLSYLSVREKNRTNSCWQIESANEESLVDPNSPEKCLKYGTPYPGMKENAHAKTLNYNTPYEVAMGVDPKQGTFMRRYISHFCLVRSDAGAPIVVRVEFDKEIIGFRCLKPGELPRRNFWDWLFNRENL